MRFLLGGGWDFFCGATSFYLHDVDKGRSQGFDSTEEEEGHLMFSLYFLSTASVLCVGGPLSFWVSGFLSCGVLFSVYGSAVLYMIKTVFGVCCLYSCGPLYPLWRSADHVGLWNYQGERVFDFTLFSFGILYIFSHLLSVHHNAHLWPSLIIILSRSLRRFLYLLFQLVIHLFSFPRSFHPILYFPLQLVIHHFRSRILSVLSFTFSNYSFTHLLVLLVLLDSV